MIWRRENGGKLCRGPSPGPPRRWHATIATVVARPSYCRYCIDAVYDASGERATVAGAGRHGYINVASGRRFSQLGRCLMLVEREVVGKLEVRPSVRGT